MEPSDAALKRAQLYERKSNDLSCCKKFIRQHLHDTERPLQFTASRPSQETAEKTGKKAADAAQKTT
jgi:hypothetical protein